MFSTRPFRPAQRHLGRLRLLGWPFSHPCIVHGEEARGCVCPRGSELEQLNKKCILEMQKEKKGQRRDRPWEWIAHETQYAILMYNFGMTYSYKWLKSAIPFITAKLVIQRTAVHTRFADISDGSAFNHIPHCEALDGLVFGHASRAVGATDETDVATAFLVAATIASFFSLHNSNKLKSVSGKRQFV